MKFVRKLLIVVLILGAFRILLPFVALAGINFTLRNKIEDYTGRLKDLDLALWRGQIVFKGLHLERKDKPSALQFEMDKASANWSWQRLWDKNLVAEIAIDGVQFVMTEMPKRKPPQPDDLTFAQAREKLAKLKWSSELKSFTVRNADVRFVVPDAKVPLTFENLAVDIGNVHLSPDKEWQLANVRIATLLQGQGKVLLEGKAQPLAVPPLADMNLSVVDFDLKTLNGLLLKILPMDLTRGKFSAYLETATEEGFSNGYAKLFFDDVDVIANPQKLKSGRHFIIEAGAALGNWFLKNDKEQTVALNLPFKIKHDNVVVNKSDAFWSALENKRDELDRKIDNSVSFAQNRNERQLE